MAAELQLPRIRRIFSEQLAQSAHAPLPQFTERRVFGQLQRHGNKRQCRRYRIRRQTTPAMFMVFRSRI